MNPSQLDRAKAILAMTLQHGADHARVSTYRARNSEVKWRDGKIDQLRESTSMGAEISLYLDGRFTANSTSDLRPDALHRFLDETLAMTKVLSPDSHRKLPSPKRFENRPRQDLLIHDPKGALAQTAIERRRKARQLEEAARSAPGAERIISVETSCFDNETESAMVTSNGMEGKRQSSRFSLRAQVTIRDENNRKPQGVWSATSRTLANLPPGADVGSTATARAMQALGEKPIPSGRYPVLIENMAASRFLGGLLAALSGSAIQQKRSFLKDKLKKQIAAKTLSIVDDPHILGGLASRAYDDEGMATAKRTIIGQGVLQNLYLNTYYGSKLGLTPTSGASTNLVFATGLETLAELQKTMDKGILITGFTGGNSNEATGDFSIGIRGHWIENGVPRQAIAEMNLAGNHLKIWNRLVATGADPHPYSSWRVPSLFFSDAQFSGSG